VTKKTNTAKFCAISCIHAPHICQDSKRWVLDKLANTKGLTDMVILGDLFEASSASVHPDEAMHQLEYEFEVASGYLKDLASVLPRNCNLTWMLGNHDYNLKAPDPRRISKGVRSLCDWNNHYDFGGEFRKWKQYPYIKSSRGVHRIGQCLFYHGFDAGSNSDELEGLQMNYIMGGKSNTLMVRGHTHRPTTAGHPVQCKRSSKVLLPNWYCNVGHQRTMKAHDYPEFMKRRDTTQWGNGLLIGEANIQASYKSGKCWDAELFIR